MATVNASLDFLSSLDGRNYVSYKVSEAAYYLGMNPTRLLTWVRGTDKTEPILEIKDKRLSFCDLASAHVLLAFRHYRISLQAIRRGLKELIKHYGDQPYPLLNRDFRTDGKNKHWYIKTTTETADLSEHSQLMLREIVDDHLERLEFDHYDIAHAFYPLRQIWAGKTGHKRIIIDPVMAGGKPVITGTGIAVSMIWERFKNHEDVESLARDYGISVEDVKEAIQYSEAA